MPSFSVALYRAILDVDRRRTVDADAGGEDLDAVQGEPAQGDDRARRLRSTIGPTKVAPSPAMVMLLAIREVALQRRQNPHRSRRRR